MRDKICILRKTQVLAGKDKLKILLSTANDAYELENFLLAESILLNASEMEDITIEERAAVFNRLAGLSCVQGMYSSAAKYYQRFLQLKAFQFGTHDADMQPSIEIYKALRALRQAASTHLQEPRSGSIA
jgi:hypothetical protein